MACMVRTAMMRTAALSFLFFVLLAAPPALAADRYEFDKSHTRILFFINHLGFSDMIGEFTDYNGHFRFDPKRPEESSVEIVLRPASIRTSSSDLDKHLQDPQFFHTEKFPEIRFVSNSVKITGSNTADVIGDMTMLGVTRPVTLHVTFNKADYNPYSKAFIAGFSVTATIKRSEFGMNSLMPAVSDEVRLQVELEGINSDRKNIDAIKR